MLLFSSEIERDAAFPDGVPDGFDAAVVGVGLIDAAIGTTRLVSSCRPDRLIFLGTCGAHRTSGIEVGQLVLATDAVVLGGDIVDGRMRLPTLVRAEAEANVALNAQLTARAAARGAELVPARVSCTLGITEDDDLADMLAPQGAVENLEAFAVLRAAGVVPAAVVLGVTNMVGAGGGRDWAANYQAMMRRVAQAVIE